MEVDDEDVLFHGTELQKYLNDAGYTEFKAFEQTNVKTNYHNKSYKKDSKYSKRPQNCTEDFNLCITLIKIILESQLIFKEDTLFAKEFIPSENIKYSLFLTKRNCTTFILLCIFCGLLNAFILECCDTWITLSMFLLWFGHVSLEILFKLIQSRKIKNIVIKTIKSMEKSSLLIQKLYKFLCDCDKLYNIHNSCNDTSEDKNSNIYLYLLMPELKSLLLTELQDLIDCLVYNISEVHKFFPLKDSVKNIIYLYLTDCKIDIENTSLENINRAKYTYYLLQSEFLKQLTLCLNPVLWTPKSYSKLNHLIKLIGELEKLYSNSYNILSEEYNIYSLFKHSNNLKNNNLNNNINIDLKSKVYSIRQVLQNMMIHVRVMEDSIEMPLNYCNDSINASISILVKEITIFNELISTFQIGILKANKEKKNEIVLSNNTINEIKNNSLEENNDPIKFVCDELFFGVSEKISDETDDTFFGEEIFDKSNNNNLILELKVALKEKQIEWKQREEKLQKEHIQLKDDLSDEENCHENYDVNNQSNNSIRKVAIDMGPDNSFSMQLPSKTLANEIASIASKWNTEIESFGDDSNSDADSDE